MTFLMLIAIFLPGSAGNRKIWLYYTVSLMLHWYNKDVITFAIAVVIMSTKERSHSRLPFCLIMAFDCFLSISFPFKTSLTSCFPCVTALSVAVYVVKSNASLEILQRGVANICVFEPYFVNHFFSEATQGVGCHN